MVFLTSSYRLLIHLSAFIISGFIWFGELNAYSETSVWIEAEDAAETNFVPGAGPSKVTPDSPGTSGAQFLTLAAHFPKDGNLPFFADYQVPVAKAGAYRLWVAASPQDVGWTSPFSISIDGGKSVSLEGKNWVSEKYGNPPRDQFGWLDAGEFNLNTGLHTLHVEAIHARTEHGDHLFHGFLDAFLFTTDRNYIPKGIYPKYSTQKPWKELLGKKSARQFQRDLEISYYKKRIAQLQEGDSEKDGPEIYKKLMARPLPGSTVTDPGPHEFGVHGMEAPFVRVNVDEDKVQKAYELMARVGVQSFRTAESCWHRLGEDYNNFRELDYQVNSAGKYGITQMFTVGYPPRPFNVAEHGLSAVKPQYNEKYKDYLTQVLRRYKGRSLIRYLELANEVDALKPWWVDSTAEMYVSEMRMVKEICLKEDPSIKTVAFGATYSRDEERGGPVGGRRFVRKCFDLSINDYADAYSLHYTWELAARDFPAFFNREMEQRKLPLRPLMNSEETSYGKPSDIIKLFARDFYLYGMVRVDYYLAQDWFEMGNCLTSGLFDMEWRPKRRLLAYAAAVDGMKNRELVGLAEPVQGIEAYVLRSIKKNEPSESRYSIVIWKNGETGKKKTESDLTTSVETTIKVSGWKRIMRGTRWNLDPLKIGGSTTLEIGEEPIVIFCEEPPDWRLESPQEWLKKRGTTYKSSEILVPQ